MARRRSPRRRNPRPWWHYALAAGVVVVAAGGAWAVYRRRKGLPLLPGEAPALPAASLEAPTYADDGQAPADVSPGTDEPAEAPSSGLPQLFWPVPAAHITSPFGLRKDPITGKAEGHNGIDLRAAEGTPLTAPGDGTIVSVWSDSLNGNALKLKTNGLMLGFAHLQSVAVSKGDQVTVGQVIAHTGGGGPHEGHSTGPHVHMTVRDATNTIVDPMTAVAWSQGSEATS